MYRLIDTYRINFTHLKNFEECRMALVEASNEYRRQYEQGKHELDYYKSAIRRSMDE